MLLIVKHRRDDASWLRLADPSLAQELDPILGGPRDYARTHGARSLNERARRAFREAREGDQLRPCRVHAGGRGGPPR